jgi:putative tryptophan/tyrosine transport system substrate-binding protein
LAARGARAAVSDAGDRVPYQVAVIAAAGAVNAPIAAKAATATIPIVFSIGGDPVKAGLVASLNRPGGNVTGVTSLSVELAQKQLEMLHQFVPTATIIAALVNPTNPFAEPETRDLESAAHTLGLQIHVLHASSERDFETAFATLLQLQAGALVIANDALFNSRYKQLAALTVRHAVPTIFGWRGFAAAGGLMSYGTNVDDMDRQAGIYVGKILKGTKPADLPILQPTKFDLIINLKTAKALGLTVPLIMQMTADQVIE